ncbi:MAG TPA: amidinotransferase [Polyangia bacterium]|jgi:glycine amidinotransferase
MPAAAPVVQSWNEWDPLEEVIVGSALGAMYPECGPILAAGGEPEWLWHYQGAFVEDDAVQAAVAQLDELVRVLRQAGVKVRRPEPMPHNVACETPFWRCRGGWNTANPRDLVLVVGDELIECASPVRHRHFESLAYHRLFTEYFQAGARWSSAPRPALRDALYDQTAAARIVERTDPARPKTLARGAEHAYPITDLEPVFEAADFMRCGRDLFVTRSVVTNAPGIEWVRRHLGAGFRVHEIATRCAAPWHIDTTFVPLAPGKALVNPDWVEELPACLASWKILPAPRPTYGATSPMAQPQLTSQWLSMNVLSLDEKRVLVDAQQAELIRALRGFGFEPVPIPFDAVGVFGGSFHCATLDVRRRGALESYCG